MRHTQSRSSRQQQERDEFGRFTESDGRRTRGSRSGYRDRDHDDYRDDWEYEQDDYDQPYAEEEYEYEDEGDYETGRSSRGGRRGFASMPRSEVRRIAAMGGQSSHGGRSTEDEYSSEYEEDYDDYNDYETRRGARSGGRRGFASMPRSEVRRVPSIRGRASGGGRYSSRGISSRGRSQDGRRSSSRSSNGGGRGFASMSQSEVRRIASMGGRASHGGGRSSQGAGRSSQGGRRSSSRSRSRSSR